MKSKIQIANIISLLVILAMLIAPVSSVSFAASPEKATTPPEADGATQPAPATGTPDIYLVRLADAPLASYQGSISGLDATSPLATGARKLDADSPASQAYMQYLSGKHAELVSAMAQKFNREIEVVYQYFAANNGLAVRLSATEALEVAKLPGVIFVQPDKQLELHTDYGPTWIGAPGIWDGTQTGGLPATMGEDIIVGVIDTGINPSNPSFADVGPIDGYDHTNPLGPGVYVGVCDPTDPLYDPTFPCNDKLIGARGYTGVNGGDPRDYDGHGSHTASTAAGNIVTATLSAPTTSYVARISGVAPHANIIAYAACCAGSSLAAAYDDIILDGVDVVNHSIGSTGCASSDPWTDFIEVAFLEARNAGIFVANSAGNCGPGSSTLGSPAEAPWLTAVGASTHNRSMFSSLINMSGGTPPPDMQGVAISAGYGPATIVHSSAFGDALCLNPFPAGTWTNGEIVMCDRGINARVDKGANVLAGGAGGFVLGNTDATGEGIVADPHFLPAVHVGDIDGDVLRAWLGAPPANAPAGGLTAEITGLTLDLDSSNGDIMAGFSSRGPGDPISVLKPDVTAPGQDIFAAHGQGDAVVWNIISGTSMASPHVAGSAALLISLHPTWTPAELQSALMTTAWTTLLKEDGVTTADLFDIGSGRVDLGPAAQAGLLLDETYANYIAANPGIGGDPRTLNLASMEDWNCSGTCVFTRTVSSPLSYTVDWDVTVEVTGGLTMTVTPSSFTLLGGFSQELVVTVDASNTTAGAWQFAQVHLTPSEPVIAASNPASGTPVSSSNVPVVPANVPVEVVTSPEQCSSYENYPGIEPAGYSEICLGSTPPANAGDSSTLLDPTDIGYVQDLRVTTGQNLKFFNLNNFPVQTVVGMNTRPIFAMDFDATATTLYAIDNTTRELGTRSLVDGSFTPVAVVSGILTTDNISGLTIDPATGVAYVSSIDATTGAFNLFTIDLTTAVATPIGSDPSVVSIIDIAVGPQGVMYAHSIATDSIYTVNMSTGALTLVGATGFAANFAQGMDFDNADGTLYIFLYIGTGVNEYGTVNLSTGAVTSLASSNPLGEFEGATQTVIPAQTYVEPALAHMPVAVLNPGAPIIEVSPDTLESEQAMNQVVNSTLTISNTGSGDLDWNIFEDPDAPTQAGFWSDNFDSYPTGQDLHGVGGWKGWDNSPAATAFTSAAQALSSPNSVDISAGADLVREYTGATGGTWIYTAWQYVPSTMTGLSYFILLNTYADGGPNNWSTQVNFDAAANTVVNDGASGGTLTLVEDQWVEIRVEIDLNNDTQDFYYNNQLLYSGTWTDENSGGGALNIGAVDLYANGATAVYYDDISLVAGVPPVPTTCDFATDIPWVSVSPSSGSTAGGTADDATVSFDSTSLPVGVYTGTLCVESNDLTNPLVTVPLTLTVLDQLPPSIDVSPDSLANTQGPDVTTTWDLVISNTGEADLDWTIDEDDIPNVLYSTVTIPSAPAGSVTIGDGLLSFSTNGSGTGNSVAHTLNAPTQGLTTITHSTSQSIVAGSIACTYGVGLPHTDNSYIRSFTLADFGITDQFDVTEIQFGVESATGLGGDQPATVNLYTWDPLDPFTFANFALIGTTGITVTDQTLSIVSVPVAGTVPAGSTLVVEVFSPDGNADGNRFFVGSNAAGQSAPSYLASAPCGITNPTDLAAIGFPNMHIVMNVTGEVVSPSGVCVNPEDISWASVNPLSGTTAGGSANTVEVTFDSTGLGSGVYTGTLCVSSNDLSNPLVTVPLTLTVDTNADLSLTKSAPVEVALGATFTYTLDVANVGPATALTTTVTDALPAGVTFVSAAGCTEAGGTVTCDLGNLASGGNATIEIVVTADVTGTLTNTASVASSSPDPDTSNNSDSAETDVIEVTEDDADLSIDKSGPSEVILGADFTYTLDVSNAGLATALNTTVTDILPAGVTFVSATAGCIEAGGTVTCDLGDLAEGDSATVEIVVTADAAGTLTNTASVASDTPDPIMSNNSDSVETEVVEVTAEEFMIYLPLVLNETEE